MATLAPTARLRGRAVELRTLADTLGRAAGGRPAFVVIEGEAGIGKSRLLAEAMEAARARGLQTDAFGCSRSSPDPRRAAIAALLATHGATGASPPSAATPASSSRPSTPWAIWWRRWRGGGRWWSAWTTCSGPTRPAS
jgi:AAA ATPase domain